MDDKFNKSNLWITRIKVFLPFYVKAGKFDWIKLERFGKLEAIIQFYENQRDKNEKGEFIKNEDKWISTQIKLLEMVKCMKN